MMCEYMTRTTYTPEIHAMSAAQVWAAWKAQQLTMGQVASWQCNHGIYFDCEGRTTK